MSSVPVTVTSGGGQVPLWGKKGGIWVPLWGDSVDPCECCADCLPCEGTCTTGWAEGGYTAVECPSFIKLLDNSVPPDGFCYKESIWKVGDNFYYSTNREYELPWTFDNCFEVMLISIASCCDYPEHCGTCADTTFYEVNPNLCCCYGGECVEGEPTINWPDEVSITVDSFSYNVDETPGFCTYNINCRKPFFDWFATKFPGTYIVPFESSLGFTANYHLLIDEGPVSFDCCSNSVVPAHKILEATASMTCEGLVHAHIEVRIAVPDELPSTCQRVEIGGFINNPITCHGTYSNPLAGVRRDSGGFCSYRYEVRGISVTW